MLFAVITCNVYHSRRHTYAHRLLAIRKYTVPTPVIHVSCDYPQSSHISGYLQIICDELYNNDRVISNQVDNRVV